MYNSKIRANIYKYLAKRKDDPLFQEQRREWCANHYNRMKEENGERYLKKKTNARIRYWLKNIKESDNPELILEKLKKKDIELFERIEHLIEY